MSWMVNDDLVKTITIPNAPLNAKEMVKALACESVSAYCYMHHYANCQLYGCDIINLT